SAPTRACATPWRPSWKRCWRARRPPSRAWTTPSRRATSCSRNSPRSTSEGQLLPPPASPARGSGGRRRVKRAAFRNRWLPYLRGLPRGVVPLVFFSCPAFGPLPLSLSRSSPFGDRLIFAGLDNFTRLLGSADYLQSVVNSFVFAFAVTFGGLAISLGLAVLANQQIRGLALYRTALLWPYGIAPAVAGVIWVF